MSFKTAVPSIYVFVFFSSDKDCEEYIVVWLFDAVICATVAVSIPMHMSMFWVKMFANPKGISHPSLYRVASVFFYH